jgi:hypothetical protein
MSLEGKINSCFNGGFLNDEIFKFKIDISIYGFEPDEFPHPLATHSPETGGDQFLPGSGAEGGFQIKLVLNLN